MEKQRISIYMDSDLVRRADAYQRLANCGSRNEFVAAAMENYIASLQGNAMEDASWQ
jgi:metal-responsive CopG/Arc/MetJ family transcriptional regulator